MEKEQINGEFYSSNTMPQVTMALNQQLNQLQSSLRAKALGLSEEEVASLNASVPFSVQKITFNENGEMNTEEDFTSIRLVVGMATTILLFIFIVTYASIIAQEIASEKGTRIMEVIIKCLSTESLLWEISWNFTGCVDANRGVCRKYWSRFLLVKK